MIETRVNVSAVACDVLKTVISRIPLIKKTSPLVNALTLFGQEFFAFEMHLQAGLQHNDAVNFNVQQERLRTARMALYNLNIVNTRLEREVTFFPLMNRRNYANHMSEIYSRSFYDVRFLFTIDLDLFGKLATLTASKETSLS